ncbi:hypothetical protein SAMN05444273_11612 [Litoreibacter ascidiaceicola]|uniref:Uncharacterized protein n=1 Tax=Litoreibacter ascidiaceicola TaxID=1486859 RepID=A0A1M5EX54_9RHOB|nr:hypothetical protein SAMN05444273_11612 [Litoreibacter ascidiaceicola]
MFQGCCGVALRSVDRSDKFDRGLAVGTLERAGESNPGHAILLDAMDEEEVFGDVIEGLDDDGVAFSEALHQFSQCRKTMMSR